MDKTAYELAQEATTEITMADLMQATVDEGASDLHIRVGGPPYLRCSGALEPLDVPPLKVSMKGRRMIMPGRRFCEYQIRGEVEEVRQGHLEQMPVTLMYMRFPFDGRAPMLLPIYASKMVLKDYEPQPGDEIDAYVWLQARVIDFDPQAPDAADDAPQSAPRQ